VINWAYQTRQDLAALTTVMPQKGPQLEKDGDEVEGDEAPVEKDKHRWDAADLEKVGED